ncbi:MAG: glycosyltransferase family 2 protein [Balneolaceae bacterium]
MAVYAVIQYIIAAVAGLLLGYQMLLSFFALKGKIIKNFKSIKYRRFSIVIPAHNEEKVLSKTIYSLFSLLYPKTLFDVIVVADNCSDNTAKIARQLGATVFERTNEKKQGKGYALRWAFDKILSDSQRPDAIIVFDADSLVSGNYLNVMNYYLEKGNRVVQSGDLVLPDSGAWSSETIRIGFLLYNYVKPLGRKVLGLDMGLRGNGMCFSTEVLEKNPWQAWSLTEDVEFGLMLLLRKVKIKFAPEAIVWAQMPANSKNAESQRKRWEIGKFPVIRKFTPKLLSAFFRTGSPRYLDACIDLVTPPLVNTLLLVVMMGGLNTILWYAGWVSQVFVWIWTGILLMGILHLFVGLYAAGADRRIYRSILYIPIYVIWKIKVYAKAMITVSDGKWVRTKRELEL